jgi:hypothetical protein
MTSKHDHWNYQGGAYWTPETASIACGLFCILVTRLYIFVVRVQFRREPAINYWMKRFSNLT